MKPKNPRPKPKAAPRLYALYDATGQFITARPEEDWLRDVSDEPGDVVREYVLAPSRGKGKR